MSFAKANIKRFNEESGCAPPVGAYNPKEKEKKGAVIIDKSERFKVQKDVVPGVGSFDISACTPTKALKPNDSVCSQASNMSFAKPKNKPQQPIDSAKVKELEKEIKKLLLERTEQGKQISHQEEEIKKIEGRLQIAQSDKISLVAKVATLEKEQKEIRKSNEVLKNKLSSTEAAGKRFDGLHTELSSLKQQIENKDKEIARLKQELETIKASHLFEINVFENVINILEIKIEALDWSNIEQMNKVEEDKENVAPKETKPLKTIEHARKHSLKEDQKRVEKLQKRFSVAMDMYGVKIEEFSHKIQAAVRRQDEMQHELNTKEKIILEQKDTLLIEKRKLQSKLRELGVDNWENEDQIRHLKGEVSSVQDNIKLKEQRIFEANAEIAALHEKMEVIEEEKNTLNNNIQSLTEKFHVLELALDEEQSRNRHSIEKLEAQLHLTRDNLQDLQTEYDLLQCKNKQLIQSLNVEKEEVEKLTYQLSDQRLTSGDMGSLLEVKEELITDLEIQLEANKVEMQNVKEMAEEYASQITELQHNLAEMEETLCRKLTEEASVHNQTAREHADRILELEQKEIYFTEEKEKYLRVNEELKEKCSVLDNQVAELSQNVSDLKKKCDTEMQRIEESKKGEINQLQIELGKITEENKELNNNVKEHIEKMEVYKEKISTYEKEISTLELKLEDMETDYFETVKRNANELEETNQKLEQVQVLKLELLQQIEDLSMEKGKVEKEYDELQSCYESYKTEVSNREHDLMDDYESLNKELQEVADCRDDLTNKLEDLTAQVAELQKSGEEKVRGVQTELDSQKENTENLRESLKKMTLKENQTKELVREKEKALESLKKEIQQLMTEIDYLSRVREQDQTEIKNSLELLEKRVMQLSSEKAHLNTLLADQRSEKSALECESMTMRAELEEIKEEHEKYKTTISAEVHTMSERLAEFKAEKFTAEQTIQELDARVESLQIENEEITNQCEGLQDKVDEMKEAKENLKMSLQEEVDKRNDKEKEVESLQKQFSEEQNKWQEEVKSGMELLEKAQREVDNEKQLRKTMVEENKKLEQNCTRLEADTHEYKKQFHRLQDEYRNSVEHIKVLTAELNGSCSENARLIERVNQVENFLEEQTREIDDIKMKHQEEVLELQEHFQAPSTSEDIEKLTAECEKWQQLYESLSAKVEPFIEQLDAFELEKQALLGRSNHAQAEIDKLSTQYAKLMGHQNQKQKIHHIIKLKEENNALRKEVTSLKEVNVKQKRTITKLEEKIDAKEGKKRFDPSKAFSFFKGKENAENTPAATPLKEGNRK